MEMEMIDAAPTPAPKFCTIEHWLVMTGMGRRATYDAMGRGELRAVKAGTRTLIDVEQGLAWINSLPPAKIKPQKRQPLAA
jgi:hypothetical protein